MKCVQLTDVSRAFGRTYAVYRVSHTFHEGRCTAILGGNGAGKSTLLNLIGTMIPPSQGTIMYGKVSYERFARRGRHLIGWLSHDTLLYPELTGRENLRFFAKLYGVNSVEDRVEKWLRRVQLLDASDEYVSSYSRGMSQRLAIARCLIHTPKLILLDEPFTGLDQRSKRDISYIFGQLREKGCIVLMITHDFSIDNELIDDVILMNQGEIVRVENLRETPNRTLLDIYNTLDKDIS